uniref:Uncharacterized protein n=1 Tax=Glaucocystis incrassata TaxID=1789788 RepID=A0A3G1IVE8_9EUKA|nr:hypothetical protein [Glaucocystis incrassata]ASQ40012.1 hypothetical protein [Glaucocystis incrassata]
MSQFLVDYLPTMELKFYDHWFYDHWAESCLYYDPDLKVALDTLYKSYIGMRNDEFEFQARPLSKRKLSSLLKNRTFTEKSVESKKRNTGVIFIGVSLTLKGHKYMVETEKLEEQARNSTNKV